MTPGDGIQLGIAAFTALATAAAWVAAITPRDSAQQIRIGYRLHQRLDEKQARHSELLSRWRELERDFRLDNVAVSLTRPARSSCPQPGGLHPADAPTGYPTGRSI